MILGHITRNHPAPHVTSDQVQQFHALASKQDPTLEARMPAFHQAASRLAQRLETLDPDRRRAAYADLNDGVLSHVKQGLATGQTKPAMDAIKAHLTKVAAQHGVPLPQPQTQQPTTPGLPTRGVPPLTIPRQQAQAV
jgi:hypothetical protein